MKETSHTVAKESSPANSTRVRYASVAGSFYPEDKDELKSKVDSFVESASIVEAKGKPRILIVPHAGITYSGQVAGAGFRQLAGKSYTRVIILGISHKSAFPDISVYPNGRWETPLGQVDVDEVFASSLMDKVRGIVPDESVHRDEHSLELELIFLQEVLNDFRIVPILIGQVSNAKLNVLVEKIVQNFDEETLLVISSDLSHYPDRETANLVDGQTIEAILTGDFTQFNAVADSIESEGYPDVVTAACGHQAIWVGLEVARRLGLTEFRKIAYSNSGDITGEEIRVVGYGAIGIWSEKLESQDVTLDENAQREALEVARSTLVSYVKEQKVPEIDTKSDVLGVPLGAFVTLRNKGDLRGCIGSFEPEESLFSVIQSMTVSAATKDPRFNPVTEDELEDIDIEISVMTPKRRISSWKEIELGKYGVVVQKGAQSGTFLPQVAADTKWSLEKFMSELCTQKAGLPENCYKDPETIIYVYEAQVFGEK